MPIFTVQTLPAHSNRDLQSLYFVLEMRMNIFQQFIEI